MAKVRVKVPTEPKIMEYPAQGAEQASVRAAHLLQPIQPQVASDQSVPKSGITISRRMLIITACFLAAAILLISAVVISRSREPVGSPQTNASQDGEAKELYDKIGKTVLLPTDELPTVANVSKEELAKQQTGLTDLQENDKVLLFAKSRKAVIYRPSIDKVIAVVTLDTPDTTNKIN